MTANGRIRKLKNIEMPCWTLSWFSFVICAPVIASVSGGQHRLDALARAPSARRRGRRRP